MKGSLFSRYFLEEGIKNTEDWKNCPQKEVETIYNKVKILFEQFKDRKKPDEADTEDGLIWRLY